MFPTWEVPPTAFKECSSGKMFYTTVGGGTGGGQVSCRFNFAYSYLIFSGDKTLYYKATVNGVPLSSEDYSKLFYEHPTYFRHYYYDMVESIERCYKSVVLTLKLSVSDPIWPYGKKIKVVMQQLDVNHDADGNIVWTEEVFAQLVAAKVLP
jgi:hypothetical protein